jgi:hypothetical protein
MFEEHQPHESVNCSYTYLVAEQRDGPLIDSNLENRRDARCIGVIISVLNQFHQKVDIG